LDGTIYVSDLEAGNDHGAVIKIAVGGAQSVLTTGDRPSGLAVDQAGNVYVGRLDRQDVQMFLPDGTLAWTAPTPGFATCMMATGVGNQICLFGWNDAVGGDSYRFDPATRALTHFGAAMGTIVYGAAVQPNGEVTVTTYTHDKVLAYHPDGSLAWTVNNSSGSFRYAQGVAIYGARDGAVPAIPATWGEVKGRYHH
jgi:streptogramin lyase